MLRWDSVDSVDLKTVHHPLGILRSSFVFVTGRREVIIAGRPATGRRVEWASIHIAWLRAGRFVEHWGNPDLLGLLTQLGEGSHPA